MRAALGWVTVAAALAACGRVGFDMRADDAGSDAGTVNGVRCETNCFPFEVYRGALSPPDWTTAAAAMDTGEVHLLYVDPRTGGVMWMYSDATLRSWTIPVAITDPAISNVSAVALIRHADESLTALVLDARVTGSTLYRRFLAKTAATSWQALDPVAILPLPPGEPISQFSATADVAGQGGAIAIASDGSDTVPNTLFFTRSTDKFATITGMSGAAWDTVAVAGAPAWFLEANVAIDSQGAPWVLYHTRNGTNDDAVLSQYTSSWLTSLPAWGDPWHMAMSLAPDDSVDVLYHQEGTTGNPQYSRATTLANATVGVAIGNMDWANLTNAGFVRTGLAREGTNLRVVWEDPETATLAARDTDGAIWSTTNGDLVGPVAAAALPATSNLVVAPQMINATSHLFWRDSVAGEYTLTYVPYTRCGGVDCAFDQACVNGACTAR